MTDEQSDERNIKRHWFDQQPATDQERMIDDAIDREFEEMPHDEKITAKKDWEKIVLLMTANWGGTFNDNICYIDDDVYSHTDSNGTQHSITT